MDTMIFIGLLGVFTYHCSAIGKEFRGSSLTIKLVMTYAGIIGYTTYYGTLIWSFWHYTWWQPIVTFVAAILIGSVTAIFFQKNIVGMIACPILVFVFAILSILRLI